MIFYMKKIFLTFLFLFTFALSVNSATTTSENGTINVYLDTSKEISPNQVEITFVVETFNSDLQKASLENKKLSENLYTSLNNLINKTRGDYIKTSNYYTKPVYIYKNNKQILDKYSVLNSVTVFSKD